MIDLIITVIACIANISLGTLVILRNPALLIARVFFASSIAISAWALTTFLSDHGQGQALVEWSTRLAYSSAFLAVALLSYFSLNFPRTKYRADQARAVAMSYAVLLVIGTVLSASDFVVGAIHARAGVTDVEAGPLYWQYLVVLSIIFGFTIYNLFRSYRDKAMPKLARSQAGLIIVGIGASFCTAIVTNGILPVLISNWNYAKVGPFLSVFLVGSVTLAIIRDHLFNIRFVLARSVAYLLLLVTMAVAYIVTAFQIGDMLFADNGGKAAHEAYNVALALILAFTFQPLRRFFERVTDNIFYRERYDSQEVLNEFSKILVSELHLDRILKKSLTQLCQSIHVQYGQLIVFHHDRVYRIEHYGPLPKRLMIVPQLTALDKSILVADELEEGERKALMTDHGIRVSLVLRTREEHIGYLLLGDKLSGDVYSRQDIDLLEIIAKELAVAISNAKAYQEIQEFTVTLQQRVDHATNRLRVANRHLKELDHAKDEFISMASHQLRTPLTTIKGYLSMMLEGDAGPLNNSQREFMNYAFVGSERMVNLISDLLNVSRLSAGRFLIQPSSVDMVQLIEDEVRQLQSHATAKGLSLSFVKPDKPLPLAEIDENKTRQVIMNFIDNAIYYTQTGGVTVYLKLVSDHIRLEVRDTGIGVPAAAHHKLFSKFYRADNAQLIRPDGTGLGLYLAKRVIEDQDGTIIFNSVEGKGSTFGFELPLHPLKSAKAIKPAGPVQQVKSGTKIEESSYARH